MNPIEIGVRIATLCDERFPGRGGRARAAEFLGWDAGFLSLVIGGKKGKKLATYQEIADKFEISLDYLLFGGNRGGLPLVGEVPAGAPIRYFDDAHERYEFTKFAGEGNYMLRVNGDSMKDAGILDGSYVIVRPTETAESGQIVVAEVDGERTVKRLQIRPKSGEVWLIPANEKKPMIRVDPAKGIRIVGVVVASIREFTA